MRAERRGLTRARLVALALLATPLAANCSSDHRALAIRAHAAGAAGRAGSGGAVGQAGSGGHTSIGGGARAGMGGMSITPVKPDEPMGRSVFTVVHGVVDADRVVLCFARVRDGATELVGDPVPAGGLGYGESLSFETIPHVASKTDGVVPFLITGDLTLLDGLDCTEAVARAQAEKPTPPADDGNGGAAGAGGQASAGGVVGAGGEHSGGEGGDSAGAAGANARASAAPAEPATAAENAGAGAGGESGASAAPIPKPPPLRVGALPGLPAGTLAEGYSLLEVADGCFGAPGFTNARSDEICGAGYTPLAGSLTAELVVLARSTMSGTLSMQALHASRGSAELGVRVIPPPAAVLSSVTLVDNFTEGALRPVYPRQDLDSDAYGAASPTWAVQATNDGSLAYAELWRVVRQRSGIDTLENGRGYTLIVIGPSYRVAGDGFWNPAAFTLVDNDPGGD